MTIAYVIFVTALSSEGSATDSEMAISVGLHQRVSDVDGWAFKYVANATRNAIRASAEYKEGFPFFKTKKKTSRVLIW